MRRAWRNLGLALAVLAVLIVGAIVFVERFALDLDATRKFANRRPDRMQMNWTTARMPELGRLEIDGFRISGQTRSVQWSLQADHVSARLDLRALVARHLQVSTLTATGVDVQVRRMARSAEQPGRFGLLPPTFPEFDGHPFVVASPVPGSGSRLAGVSTSPTSRLENLREIWIEDLRYAGSATAHGGFEFRLGDQFQLLESEIAFSGPGHRVNLGDEAYFSDLTGRLAGHIDPYAPRELRGWNVLRQVTAHGDLTAISEGIDLLRSTLAGPAPWLEISGRHGVRLAATVALERGRWRAPVASPPAGEPSRRRPSATPPPATGNGAGRSKPRRSNTRASTRTSPKSRSASRRERSLTWRTRASSSSRWARSSTASSPSATWCREPSTCATPRSATSRSTTPIFLRRRACACVPAPPERKRTSSLCPVTPRTFAALSAWPEVTFAPTPKGSIWSATFASTPRSRGSTGGRWTSTWPEPSCASTRCRSTPLRRISPPAPTEPWWGRTRIEHGWVRPGKPTFLEVRAGIHLADSRPLVLFLEERRPLPGFVRKALIVPDVVARGTVRFATSEVRLIDFSAEGGERLEFKANLVRRNDQPLDGIFFGRYRGLSVGMALRDGKRDLKLIHARQWFESQPVP